MTKTKSAVLAETTRALFPKGKGVLVLDRYAEAVAQARPGPVDMSQFIKMALTAPALEEVVSAVLLTLDGFLSTTELRGTLGFSKNFRTGVCLSARTATDDRLDHLRQAGASAVEIRANIGPTVAEPGKPAVEAPALARRARAAQDAGLVPIITFAMPDLGAQSSNVTYAVTANALRGLMASCESFEVEPSEMIIRTSMVAPGSRIPSTPTDVGRGTVAVLNDNLPSSVGGVLILSGGADLSSSCANLAAVSSAAHDRQVAWPVTFGFARPLVENAASRWDGSSGSPVARMAVTSACRAAANALSVGDTA